jgi:mono/diheme cytochrome c family protein
MRKLLLWIVVLGGIGWALTRPTTLDPDRLPARAPDPVNGERVFHAAGCGSCHGEDLSGGVEFHTAFGTFRAPNISPDPKAGIGGWSDLDLANAMMRGVSPTGEHYYPVFPYTSYTRMDPGDVIDLKAYLDGFEPSPERSKPHDVSFPFSVRRGLGLWKKFNLKQRPVMAADVLDGPAQRGRYLVESLGHCGECHTPRGPAGGMDLDLWLAGGPNPDGEGRIPNITPHEDGLAGWSGKDIAYYLETGFTPDFDTVGGSMVKVQENFARLPASDRAAVAAYLKAVPPLPTRR